MQVHLCKDWTYGIELLDKQYLDIVDPTSAILSRYEVPDELVAEYSYVMGHLFSIRSRLEQIMKGVEQNE